MRRNLTPLLGTALVANVLAIGVALFGRATMPPSARDRLADCMLFTMAAELALMAMYFVCLLRCRRMHKIDGDYLRCADSCLSAFLWLQLGIMIMFLACIFAAAFGWF